MSNADATRTAIRDLRIAGKKAGIKLPTSDEVLITHAIWLAEAVVNSPDRYALADTWLTDSSPKGAS